MTKKESIRRGELIHKKYHDGGLTKKESKELKNLQNKLSVEMEPLFEQENKYLKSLLKKLKSNQRRK